jgi:hypothetical protein
MGAARLLAKLWVAFCLFAGAHAILRQLAAHVPPFQATASVAVCVFLFGAMGLLFIGGYGASSGFTRFVQLASMQFAPGFNEVVFIAFAIAIFIVQAGYVPAHPSSPMLGALDAAMRLVPGQSALERSLSGCGLSDGRNLASALSWLLSFIFLGSALSRIRLAAGLVRLERKTRHESLGDMPLAFATGLVAVVGIQLLFIGSLYSLLPCAFYASVAGAVLIGLGPLMLAYLIAAALTNTLALNAEA